MPEQAVWKMRLVLHLFVEGQTLMAVIVVLYAKMLMVKLLKNEKRIYNSTAIILSIY